MKKTKVPPSIPVLQTAETGNPSIKQPAQNEIALDHSSDNQAASQTPVMLRRFREQLDWSLVWMILAIKGLIFVMALQSYPVLAEKPILGWRGWFDIWNHWDSIRHMRIEELGYAGVGSLRSDIVGFPLYPWIVRLFAFIFQDYLVSSFIVSGLAMVAAGLLLHRLVRDDFSDSIARNSVWFMLIFPTSYFLHINYNESLFIALTLGCFLAARRERWLIAGVLGALVCLTRLNGLVILPALLVEAFLQYRVSRRWQSQWLWIAVAPLGFGVYLLVNAYAAGDPLAFITVGREHFYKSFSMPWNGIRGVYDLMWSPDPSRLQMGGVQEFVFIMLGAVFTVASAFVLRPSYAVWMAGNWMLITSVGFLLSVPRLTIVMFPIFILFAILAERRLWNCIITVWSLLLLALFASEFIQGRWAF